MASELRPREGRESTPEEREEKDSVSFEVVEATQASSVHPGRNEDKILGRPDSQLPTEFEDDPVFGGLLGRFVEIEMGSAEKLGELSAYGIFDGISTAKGYVASRLTSASVVRRLSRLSPEAGGEETQDAMREALDDANEHLGVFGGGTTADLVRLLPPSPDGSVKAVFAHVGDGRIYRRSAEGRLERMTVDQNVYCKVIGKLLEQGEIDSDQAEAYRQASLLSDLNGAPWEVIEAFDERHVIYSSVGRGMKPEIGSFDLHPGESVVLVTDGIGDNLSGEQLTTALTEGFALGGAETGDHVVRLAAEKAEEVGGLLRQVGLLKKGLKRAEVSLEMAANESKRTELRQGVDELFQKIEDLNWAIEELGAKGPDDMAIQIIRYPA